jgi:FkbM family methyltransferase
MNTFELALKSKLEQSIYNNYGIDNYDVLRFGLLPSKKKESIKVEFKKRIKSLIGFKKSVIADNYIKKLSNKNQLYWLWNNIDQDGKELLVELIAYRILGFKKVKLSINNCEYLQAIEKANQLSDSNDTINPGFLHFTLSRMNLKPIGKNIELYFSPLGVTIDFILEQYAYKRKKQTLIEAEPGDTVFDVGGCWGDTALYFADKVGKNGKVYSFEFIPNNIDLHNKNTSLNPHLLPQIELIANPITDKTGENIYFKDNGPASKINLSPFTEQNGSTTSLTIDDFVKQKGIKKVDFIKMDIEGAEQLALKGAVNTIKKYRPKLAVAIYHSINDFVNIPRWIHDLDLDYELYLAHYTIHSEETVIFAKPRK